MISPTAVMPGDALGAESAPPTTGCRPRVRMAGPPPLLLRLLPPPPSPSISLATTTTTTTHSYSETRPKRMEGGTTTENNRPMRKRTVGGGKTASKTIVRSTVEAAASASAGRAEGARWKIRRPRRRARPAGRDGNPLARNGTWRRRETETTMLADPAQSTLAMKWTYQSWRERRTISLADRASSVVAALVGVDQRKTTNQRRRPKTRRGRRKRPPPPNRAKAGARILSNRFGSGRPPRSRPNNPCPLD